MEKRTQIKKRTNIKIFTDDDFRENFFKSQILDQYNFTKNIMKNAEIIVDEVIEDSKRIIVDIPKENILSKIRRLKNG